MVIPFGNYSECKNDFTLSQIRPVVFQVLNAVISQRRRVIGFHGIRAVDTNDYRGAQCTIDAIEEWLHYNRSSIDSITLVDANNCYSKHFRYRVQICND